jgi:single-strand DNA-binding protein
MFQHFDGVGHLTRSPELRYTPSGTPVASTGIAFNRRYKQGDELKEEVCFLDLVLFGKTAENFAQYCGKGDPVVVSGRLQQRRWEDDHGGKHSKHELVVGEFKMLKRREDGSPETPPDDPGV